MNTILDLNYNPITIIKGTRYSAGFDIPLDIKENVKLDKYVKLIPTGIKLDLNYNYHAVIIPRSSTGIKKNIHMINGLIDSDYKGQLFLQCYKIIDDDVYIEKNDYIAQLLIYKNENINNKIVIINNNDRGINGFGSTH